jgi:hypothetical protein
MEVVIAVHGNLKCQLALLPAESAVNLKVESCLHLAHRGQAAERGEGAQTTGKALPGQAGAPPVVGSQSMLFGAGIALGGVAGALLTYVGGLQRH